MRRKANWDKQTCVSVQSCWIPSCLFCNGNSRSGREEVFALQITNRRVSCFCPLPEIEAKEACDWLRAAGFPQYAQLYEGRHLSFQVNRSLAIFGQQDVILTNKWGSGAQLTCQYVRWLLGTGLLSATHHTQRCTKPNEILKHSWSFKFVPSFCFSPNLPNVLIAQMLC